MLARAVAQNAAMEQATIDLKSDGTIAIQAAQSITLQVGDSAKIELTTSGVRITGTAVEIDGASKVDIDSGGPVLIK